MGQHVAREAMWPVGGDRQRIGRSEKAEATEQWRRAEAQALTALCKTKKSVECVKKGKGQRRKRKSRGTELSY